MYDTTPSDDLQNLEIVFGKLSNHFFSSIHELKNYAPFEVLENEENFESSQMNIDRVQFEKIPKYNENKNSEQYAELINKNANEANAMFQNINDILNSMKQREEFNTTDDNLNQALRDLRKKNEDKAEKINDKIKYVDDLVSRVQTDNDINKQIHKRENYTDYDEDYEI